MPKCPKGHEQRLGLKCVTCGAEISFKDSIDDLKNLPFVKPDYGKVAVLSVGYPGLTLKSGFLGEVGTAQEEARTATSFQAAAIRGGTWLDFQNKCLKDLRRWMALIGIDKSTERFLVTDMTKPISVAAISALPKGEHTAVIAVTADRDSTPVEQNTSYVALSLALKKGLPVIALSKTFEREMLFFTEDKGFAAGPQAMSRLLEPMLDASSDVMDLLEKDVRLGIRLHSLSAIMSGSKNVYGGAANAFLAQSYNFSIPARPDEHQTLHSLVFSSKATGAEFEKSFGAFRNRKYKGALDAELRLHETSSPVYDLVTICGLKNETTLQSIAGGYEAVVKSVPELTVEGVVLWPW